MEQVVKRFYKNVGIGQVDGGYTITLDDKPLNTPAGAPFIVPGATLAEAIAGEWAIQGDSVDPITMPITQFSSTALDRVQPSRSDIIEGLLRYVETDLLCHRAEAPADLVERQSETWHPLLDWANDNLGIKLEATTGILAAERPLEAVNIAADIIGRLDVFELTALASLTGETGSLVVGLAVLNGKLNAGQAFDVSELDALWQAENWGEDEEATERRDHVKGELQAIVRFLKIARAG